MSFSGGVYTLPGPALVTGEVVSATENNQFRNDVAGAFNVTMLRNGTSTATANLPMGGYKLTGLGAATTSGDALSYGNAAVVTTLTSTSLTATRVPYAGTGGLLQDASNFTFDGTTLTAGGFSTSGNISAATASISGNVTYSGGTATGVAYLNGSKVLTTGSALTFDGTNLGVGTSSPSYKLHVRQTEGNGVFLLDSGNSSFASIFAQSAGDAAYFGTLNNYSVAHFVNGSEQMRLTSTGLGIGTSSPGYPLAVNGLIHTQGTNAGLSIARRDTSAQSWLWYSAAGNLQAYDVVAASTRMTIDSSGNLGLGVTPSAWYSGNNSRALEFNNGAIYSFANTPEFNLGMNFYLNSGGSWIYKANGVSTRYSQQSGQHQWLIAPSGTAGDAISFTQAMTLDASGNLLVGGTSSVFSASGRGVVEINGSTNAIMSLNIGGASKGYLYANNSSSTIDVFANVGWGMTFSTAGTERMRIDTSGTVILKNNPAGNALQFYGSGGSENARLGINASNGLDFAVGSTSPRMTIDSDGNLLVGTTSAIISGQTQSLSISRPGVGSGYTSPNISLRNTANASGKWWGIYVGDSGATATNGFLIFNQNSVGVYLTDGGTSWTGTSDERLKENLIPITDAANKVSTLRAVTGNFKSDKNKTRRSFLIAQDVQKVLPEAVHIGEDENKTLGLSYTDVIPLLVSAIQEQQEQIEQLKAEVAALKGN